MADEATTTIALDVSESIWERFFCVFPLVVVGTLEPDGTYDLAPKHLAMPMSWKNHFGFVCTPRHRTYQNIERTGEFTVTYARPSQAVLSSLAASPRCEDGSKPITAALPTRPAETVAGAFLDDGYLFSNAGVFASTTTSARTASSPARSLLLGWRRMPCAARTKTIRT